MTFVERIGADLASAMKEKDERRLSVLRMMRSSLKNKEIEVQHPLSDEEAQAVVRTMLKQGKDALADFTNANRHDLVERQSAELDVLNSYLPAMLTEAEVEAICEKTIQELGAQGPDDVGKVMGAAMKALAGKADGAQVRNLVQRLLVHKSPTS